MTDSIHQSNASNGTVELSLFDSVFDRQPKQLKLTWQELQTQLYQAHSHAEDKKQCKRVSFTIYKPKTARGKDNVTHITALVLDYDNNARPWDERKVLLDSAGYRYLAHSTTSHSTGQPRYRVIFPFSAPVPVNDWTAIFNYFAPQFETIDGEIDRAYGTDYSHMANLPHCPASMTAAAFIAFHDGKLLTPPAALELAPFPAPADPPKLDFRAGSQPSNAQAKYISKVIEGGLAELAAADKGCRNNVLNKVAFRLGQFQHYGEFSDSVVISQLAAIAQQRGLSESEARQTIDSGFNNGLNSPCEIPQISDRLDRAAAALSNNDPLPASPPADEIPPADWLDHHGKKAYNEKTLINLLHGDTSEWESVNTLSSNAAHAARIACHLKDDLAYHDQLYWLSWNGRHWDMSNRQNAHTVAIVKTLSDEVRHEAARLYEMSSALLKAGRDADSAAMAKAAKAHTRHIKEVERISFINDSLLAAASDLSIPADKFLLQPWRLGLANKTWERGQFHSHRRADYMLSLSPVKYNPNVDTTEWESVLDVITGGIHELATYYQNAAGYILAGQGNTGLVPWIYGGGGTGKSTFVELTATILGSEAVAIDAKQLKSGESRERLGWNLFNKRLAIINEASSSKIDKDLLKLLSGGDTLTARALYKEQFQFRPSHVLVFVSNNAPKLDAFDDALQRRIRAFYFSHKLAEFGQIPLTGGEHIESVRKMPDSPLVQGFLLWALQGLENIYRTGGMFEEPQSITQATKDFWDEIDPTTDFWATVDDFELSQGIGKTDLFKRYQQWAEIEGTKPLARNTFYRACERHGLRDFVASSDDGKRVRSWIK